MKAILTLLIAIGLCPFCISQTNATLASGDWEDNSIWSLGTSPTSGEDVVINLGHTISLNANFNLQGLAMTITNHGVMSFDSPGTKIRLETGSIVDVKSTGSIVSTGNGIPSHSIKIGGTEVWGGSDGTLNGPVVLGATELPTDLSKFYVEQEKLMARFTWETTSEKDNDFFTVEGSIDGLTWDEIIKVDGAGTSYTTNNYSEEYDNRSTQFTYFRLKQTDFDGNSSYSQVIIPEPEMNLTPNPFTGDVLLVEVPEANSIVTISSMVGKIVYQANALEGIHVIQNIDLPDGMYIINVSYSGGELTKQMIRKK